MNRPRNANRPPRRTQDPDHPNVPPISRLAPGTSVAIILKQDQPTGHRVYGVVAETLTKGDHPRGVKVRLRDGRVGRVQALVDEAKGKEGESAVGGPSANLGRDGEVGGFGDRGRGDFSSRGGGRGYRHTQDVREDGYLWEEAEKPKEYFADVEFKVKGKKGKKGRGDGGSSAAAVSETSRSEEVVGGKEEREGKLATCPVCGEFEGDERAVAHHVEQHFSEG